MTKTIVLSGVTVVDVREGGATGAMDVIVDGDRIHAITPAGERASAMRSLSTRPVSSPSPDTSTCTPTS